MTTQQTGASTADEPPADPSSAERFADQAVRHRKVRVEGLEVFYREAGPVGAPTLVLLHGFPSASHQYARLIDALSDRFHLVAPDYPGFGYSTSPQSTTTGGPFAYTFDRLADVVEGFLVTLRLNRFFLYVFDFGAPVGFRIATRHPDWVRGGHRPERERL